MQFHWPVQLIISKFHCYTNINSIYRLIHYETENWNIYSFGSGNCGKRTGIVFNSAMDDFSYPGYVDINGWTGSKRNELYPGKRPFSSRSPTIVTDTESKDVKYVVGAAGGTKIITSVAYVNSIKLFQTFYSILYYNLFNKCRCWLDSCGWVMTLKWHWIVPDCIINCIRTFYL